MIRKFVFSLAVLAGCVTSHAGTPLTPTVPPGLGPVIVYPPPGGKMVVYRGPGQRGVNGWYFHKPTKTWRHDGGTHPIQYRSDDREYIQLDDPEGVWAK